MTKFTEAIAELEKFNVSDTIWKCGIFRPGIFDCGEFCKVRKRLESES